MEWTLPFLGQAESVQEESEVSEEAAKSLSSRSYACKTEASEEGTASRADGLNSSSARHTSSFASGARTIAVNCLGVREGGSVSILLFLAPALLRLQLV